MLTDLPDGQRLVKAQKNFYFFYFFSTFIFVFLTNSDMLITKKIVKKFGVVLLKIW